MNYKHLRYFWMVARSGGVGPAARALHLTPQTLSGQIGQLEETLGRPLFRKFGRQLELPDDGQTALRFADAIFSLGAELEDRLAGHGSVTGRIEFRIGVTEAVPKTIAYRLLEPATRLATPVRLENRTGRLDALLGDLAAHRIDLVLADAPMPPSTSVRAFNHRLGTSGLSFFASAGLCREHRGRFPAVLAKMPLLVPGPDTAVALPLRRWLEANDLHPTIVGAFDDGSLMKAFGRHGRGVFVAPTAIETDVKERYAVRCIGRTDEIVEEFFAISVERRIRHPCVAVIAEAARTGLFA